MGSTPIVKFGIAKSQGIAFYMHENLFDFIGNLLNYLILFAPR